ncbi:hypothetical protein HZS_3800 [Henneguya salminicola]|nr:hypothetical protein HZS_3800 [Henneguya salminicola]
MPTEKGFSTNAIHSDLLGLEWPGSPVVCGISLSTTFKQKTPGKPLKYEYSRSSNPTRDALEDTLAVLENAKHGFLNIINKLLALCYSSGLAAETCILHLLKTNDEIVCMDDVYGGTNRLFNKVFDSFGIVTNMVDLCLMQNLKNSITDKTKIVWIESPTNPTLKIVDIQAIKKVITASKKDILLVVDNTFMSPYFQKPLELGADIVIHSVTKYINGHSDVVMGALALNDEKIHKRLSFYQNAIGAIPSAFDCYLVLRGIKTLAIRMQKHQENAMKIALYFQNHPKISDVLYPGIFLLLRVGLETHPGHEIAKKQTSGFGGMISMRLKGNLESTKNFLESLKMKFVHNTIRLSLSVGAKVPCYTWFKTEILSCLYGVVGKPVLLEFGEVKQLSAKSNFGDALDMTVGWFS